MKAERGIYDCSYVSVTTARPARSKSDTSQSQEVRSCLLDVYSSKHFSWVQNLMISTRFLSL